MGRKSTTGGVTPHGDRIQLRFTWGGREYRPTIDGPPNKTRLASARRLLETVCREIDAGCFRMEAHFPDYRFAHKVADGETAKTFGDWCDTWQKLSAREVEHSSLTIYARHLKAYWRQPWADLPVRRITNLMVRERLAELAVDHQGPDGKPRRGLSRKTQNNILIPLRGVLKLACTHYGIPNPAAGIENLEVQQGEPDPFDADEVEMILAQLRRRGDAIADYFEFAFFAGLRPSEQIALTWLDVDSRRQTIRVHQAKVLGEAKARTKTHRGRDVELNQRAWGVIERQRERTLMATKTRDGVVFMNPWTGQAWNCETEQRREFRDALLRAGVRYRPQKECRDTSVTLALAAGCDPYWVAQQHGHSVQTMLRDYARWIPKADRGRNLAAMNAALVAPAREAMNDE